MFRCHERNFPDAAVEDKVPSLKKKKEKTFPGT